MNPSTSWKVQAQFFSLDYAITMLMSKHQLRDLICHSKLFEKVAHTFSDAKEFNWKHLMVKGTQCT